MDQVRESFQKSVTIANHHRCLSKIQNGDDQTHRVKNDQLVKLWVGSFGLQPGFLRLRRVSLQNDLPAPVAWL